MDRGHRILKHQEFSEILSKCPFEKATHFVIHHRPNEAGKLRVGINVGKRNGNAVTRNRIKRQVRAFVCENFDLKKSLDLVIVVRQTYNPSLFQEAGEELKALWALIGERH